MNVSTQSKQDMNANLQFFQNIKSFYGKKDLSDASFLVGCNGHHFCATKTLLAMQSEYFHKLLYNNNFKSSLHSVQDIVINDNNGLDDAVHVDATYYETDVSPIAFEFILKFCYGYRLYDELHVTHENVLEIYYAANKYLMKPLTDVCHQFITTKINIDNIVNILVQSEKMGLKDIESLLVDKISGIMSKSTEYSCRVFNDKQIFQLSPTLFLNALIKNDLFMIEEKDIFELCIRYCKHKCAKQGNNDKNNISTNSLDIECDEKSIQRDSDTKSNTNYSQNGAENIKTYDCTWEDMMRQYFIPFIRFGIMDKNYLMTNVRQSELLTCEQLWDIMCSCWNVSYFKTKDLIKCRFNSRIRIGLSQDDGSIPYTLHLSSEYPGLSNDAALLRNTNYDQGCGTGAEISPTIEAKLGQKTWISRVEVVAPMKTMHGDWGKKYFNDVIIEYCEDGRWQEIKRIGDVKPNKAKSIFINKWCTSIRFRYAEAKVASGKFTYMGLSCLRLY